MPWSAGVALVSLAPTVALVASAAVVISDVPAATGFVIAILVIERPRMALAVGVVASAQVSHAAARSSRGVVVDCAGAGGTVTGAVSKNGKKVMDWGASAIREGGGSNDEAGRGGHKGTAGTHAGGAVRHGIG